MDNSDKLLIGQFKSEISKLREAVYQLNHSIVLQNKILEMQVSINSLLIKKLESLDKK